MIVVRLPASRVTLLPGDQPGHVIDRQCGNKGELLRRVFSSYLVATASPGDHSDTWWRIRTFGGTFLFPVLPRDALTWRRAGSRDLVDGT